MTGSPVLRDSSKLSRDLGVGPSLRDQVQDVALTTREHREGVLDSWNGLTLVVGDASARLDHLGPAGVGLASMSERAAENAATSTAAGMCAVDG